LSFTVSVSERAQRDLDRLEAWLCALDLKAAARLSPLLLDAFDSLAETPLRGRITGPTTREINVPFGHHAYIIRYRARGPRVTVTRIWHSLEHR
jgi:plasmid stabilization system protein ParE